MSRRCANVRERVLAENRAGVEVDRNETGAVDECTDPFRLLDLLACLRQPESSRGSFVGSVNKRETLDNYVYV